MHLQRQIDSTGTTKVTQSRAASIVQMVMFLKIILIVVNCNFDVWMLDFLIGCDPLVYIQQVVLSQ